LLNESLRYNILKIAGYSLGFIHSENSKVKMSEAKKGEKSLMFGKTGKYHPFFGKTHSIESIKKISKAKKGKNHPMFRKSYSPDVVTKICQALAGENNSMSKKYLFIHLIQIQNKLFCINFFCFVQKLLYILIVVHELSLLI
jgi:group I intron endonuclease